MEATQIVHWPGKDSPACDAHAAKLKTVAAFMGFAASTTLANGEPCANCENEAKQKAGKP